MCVYTVHCTYAVGGWLGGWIAGCNDSHLAHGHQTPLQMSQGPSPRVCQCVYRPVWCGDYYPVQPGFVGGGWLRSSLGVGGMWVCITHSLSPQSVCLSVCVSICTHTGMSGLCRYLYTHRHVRSVSLSVHTQACQVCIHVACVLAS